MQLNMTVFAALSPNDKLRYVQMVRRHLTEKQADKKAA